MFKVLVEHWYGVWCVHALGSSLQNIIITVILFWLAEYDKLIQISLTLNPIR